MKIIAKLKLILKLFQRNAERLKPAVLLAFICAVILLHQNLTRQFNIILLAFLIIHVYFFVCLYSLFKKLRSEQKLSMPTHQMVPPAPYHI